MNSIFKILQSVGVKSLDEGKSAAVIETQDGVVISTDESQQAKSIAQKLLAEISALEDEIIESQDLADEIESRGILKRIFSDSSKDLIDVAKTQNGINRRMVDLIQETIRLNMLSYAGLVCLMGEMQKGLENGFTDANGHITRLGDEGRDLAKAATNIISSIIDASQNTQGRIEQHAIDIADIGRELDTKNRLDSEQDQAIALLEQQLEEKSQLDAQQSAAIRHLLERSKEKQSAIDDLSERMRVKQERIDEHRVELEKLIVQDTLFNERLHRLEVDLQQYQGDALGQIDSLERSLWSWRWITVALVFAPIAWLAVNAWYQFSLG